MKQTYPKLIKELPTKVKDCIGQEHKQGYFQNKDTWSSRPGQPLPFPPNLGDSYKTLLRLGQ